jgi:CRP/FNR family transcriptional regulator, cyclic AMP receptor protein
MAKNEIDFFDVRGFARKHGGVIAKYPNKKVVYAQGDPADALFHIVSGAVKVTIISEAGREAIVAVLKAGHFFGEGCLGGQLIRHSTIATTSPCEIARFPHSVIAQALTDDPSFVKLFVHFILDRNEVLKADLIDHIFNSSEKRLARILLALSTTETKAQFHLVPIDIDQNMLASMVGTTRSRVNRFMNKFRKLGYIDYNGRIRVNNSLLHLFLSENPQKDVNRKSMRE